MLWIGAVFGALFGWIGILVAALFWATLAVFKLLWALTLFALQLIIGVSALIARATIHLFNWASQRRSSPSPAPRARTVKAIPAGLKPRRVAPKRKVKKRA
jgi:hypothetical protein